MVKVCRGGAQVVVAVPHAIKSLWLQPYLGGNIERLVGVVWSDFVLLWGSLDRQGASLAVLPSSSSLGWMWSSWPVRRLPIRNQQHQADSGRSNSGCVPSIRSRGWRWRASQRSRCNFRFSCSVLYCSLFLLMLECYSQKKKLHVY
jgi:hypothetical protein